MCTIQFERKVFDAITAAWFLLFISIGTDGYSQEKQPVTLRVLSYNIHHAEGVDGKLDLERIAKVINSVNPDLVALQEVDENVKRSGSVNQAGELGNLTNLKVSFGPNIDLQGGKYGNAILSRFEIIHNENVQLPVYQAGEQRGLLKLLFKHPDTDEVMGFWCTHLDHRPNEFERMASALAINAEVQQQAEMLMIMAGDFNCELGSKPIKELAKYWPTVNDKPLPTIPVSKPERQIDFVMQRLHNQWKVTEVTVLDEWIASDHRPILAVFEKL